MGRKLNPLEEGRSSLADSDRDGQKTDAQAQRRQQLLDQIAEQLGITAKQLCERPVPSGAVRPAIETTRQSDLVVNQQCSDLVEAFLQIRNPQDRLRCLQFVRDTALAA